MLWQVKVIKETRNLWPLSPIQIHTSSLLHLPLWHLLYTSSEYRSKLCKREYYLGLSSNSNWQFISLSFTGKLISMTFLCYLWVHFSFKPGPIRLTCQQLVWRISCARQQWVPFLGTVNGPLSPSSRVTDKQHWIIETLHESLPLLGFWNTAFVWLTTPLLPCCHSYRFFLSSCVHTAGFSQS